MIGETVGNYKVIAQLGEGGMGMVYLAEHPLIGSKVAIKVLHDDLSRNPDVVSRFFTEARSVNDIRHPNIVEIADFGDKDGRCYIVMEFLEGESLAGRLKRLGMLDEETAARIGMQVASALGAAHDRGIVHRDLKPDNVFLTKVPGHPEGVRVLDFGIAKLVGDPFETSHRTQTGVVIGTPFYMSPEQCLARKDLDGRSDIYALGILLYELVTGTVPFPFENLGELIVAHTGTQPRPPTERNPRVTAEMSQVIMRTLEKDPNDRYATMSELIEALAPVAGVPASTQTPTDISATLAAGRAPTPVPGASTTLSSAAGSRDAFDDDVVPTRSRVPLLVGGVAVVGVVAVVAVMMTGKGSGAGEPAPESVAATSPVVSTDAASEPADPPAPPEPAPARQVVVKSSPDAELFVGDVNLGETPVSVDLPTDESSIEIELRAKGHHAKKLVVNADTGPELVVTLDKRKRRSSRTTKNQTKKKKKKKSTFTVKPIE